MSDDIVRRLRNMPLGNMYAHQALMEEAADEIERLREAKRRALEIADQRVREANSVAAENMCLRKEVAGYKRTRPRRFVVLPQ